MTLEDLIEKFAEHGKGFHESNECLIKEFLENNPGQELPDNLKGDFNLPYALGFMCSEILKLRDKNEPSK